MNVPTAENLANEAQAFDHQIDERIRNGHIPDLRTCEPCDWFYNNPWRRPAYVKLDFGEQFELIRDAIRAHVRTGSQRLQVLEVGCGPGYMSLELARAGFDVTGIDVSARCVEVAQEFAAKDPLRESRASLSYRVADFLASPLLHEASFDAVVFVGALHHFPQQAEVASRVRQLLKPGGVIVAHEPVRDRVTRGNAVFMHLMRVLLSAKGGFYADYPVPRDAAACESEFDRLFAQMRYEAEDGDKLQSVNDNEAGYAEMYPVLSATFEQVVFEWRYAFFHELIGGLRFDEATNAAMARYLRDIDGQLVKQGVLNATEFMFVGRKAMGAQRA